MPDNSVDPSGNTEAFRAFTRTTPEGESSKAPLVIAGAAVAVVLIALVAWLTLG